MSGELLLVLALLGVAIVLFSLGRPRADVVALLMVALLPFTGVIDVSEAIAGFADPSVVLIALLFVIGEGLVRTGLAQRISSFILRVARGDETVLLVALMLSALGLLLSNAIRQLENFAGVMNFVIFPLFFLSSALYPLWKMRDSSEWLYWLCAVNPFTHAVELVRFALYERFAGLALAVCLGLTLLFTLLAVLTFNPQHAALRKKG